jgi:hypothetical protein
MKLLLNLVVLITISFAYCKPHYSFNGTDYQTLAECSIVSESERFDCYPEEGANESDCLNRGCCWMEHKYLLDIAAPYCYYPRNFPHYKVLTEKTIVETHGASYYINKMASTFRKNEILNLTVDLFYDTEKRLRVQISDTNRARYEVPLEVDASQEKLKKSANSDYYVSIVDEPFAIKVYRKSTQRLVLVFHYYNCFVGL